jgi:hypothetical protein
MRSTLSIPSRNPIDGSAGVDGVLVDRVAQLREIVDSTVRDFEASENAKLMNENFEAAFRLMCVSHCSVAPCCVTGWTR